MRRRTLLTTAAAALALPAAAQTNFLNQQWPNTDFSRAAVPLSEIRSGGVPRDGIPALDGARFGAATGLDAREPVVTVALDGQPERAYPMRYLMWHEIVNDAIGGVPVAVTYCPLCNSALVFDRRAAGMVLTFGVSGLLRHSGLVMYDRQTESWWQQFTGEAIVGRLTGTTLTQLVSWTEPVSAFAARNAGNVMQQPGAARRYGSNPYVGYDGAAKPFLYSGEDPPHGIPPLARVVRVGDRAWPLSRFQASPVIEVAGLRLEWRAGMASALDTGRIAQGRDVGAIRVYGTDGRPVPHEVVFAFAFHAFTPNGQWMLGR
ncbi:DUF3179 domain-containing protein [Rhodobacteraceae bacterium 2CG4]|uniref:DUF3179 domain-containing protein n=1 Tax=Halovulum marinum TaxID=2662447 RepID=A0A6L5Z1L7_9RHOB|nr:DUF3179 domain-containing protein [Halovulum marinum]MSU89972.1 DUF3179 domain-containing protein [Halovulum marinum]